MTDEGLLYLLKSNWKNIKSFYARTINLYLGDNKINNKQILGQLTRKFFLLAQTISI